MFDRVKLENFGPWTALDWRNLGGINLILGGNSAGKTFLLKAIYSALRTLETYKRGDEPRSASEILIDKLHWTFQAEKVGDLVLRQAQGPLSFAWKIISGHAQAIRFSCHQKRFCPSIRSFSNPANRIAASGLTTLTTI